MLTKFNLFENNIKNNENYMIGHDIFFMSDLYNYLSLDFVRHYNNEVYITPENYYNINIIQFVKEIILDKYIIFDSVNKPQNNPTIKGVVEDVDHFTYNESFFIKVKIKNKWYLVSNNTAIIISNYDGYLKPLHKEVELKKEAEKYNL